MKSKGIRPRVALEILTPSDEVPSFDPPPSTSPSRSAHGRCTLQNRLLFRNENSSGGTLYTEFMLCLGIQARVPITCRACCAGSHAHAACFGGRDQPHHHLRLPAGPLPDSEGDHGLGPPQGPLQQSPQLARPRHIQASKVLNSTVLQGVLTFIPVLMWRL